MSIADLMRKADVRPDALQGKVAIVTGAGRGIGKPAAQGLALLGASVVVAEIMDTGQATADEIVAAGGRAIFVKTDVSQSASMEALRDRTLEAFGPADIFINNATAFTTKPLLDLTVDEWDRVFSVNLSSFSAVETRQTGVLEECIRHLGALMRSRLRTLVFSYEQSEFVQDTVVEGKSVFYMAYFRSLRQACFSDGYLVKVEE